jgi:transcriptional regulator with XRE-family HTH domain
MENQEDSGLAARLKRLRRGAGLTQQQLAGAAGLSMSLITQLEQGAKTDPRMSTLKGLARALGVGVNALVENGDGGAGAKPATKTKKGRK